jgi:hypothetical protein
MEDESIRSPTEVDWDGCELHICIFGFGWDSLGRIIE